MNRWRVPNEGISMEPVNVSDATPRPWTCHEGWIRTVAGPWGIICECIAGFEDCPHDANANAALIVEAVNAHARLTAMAEAGAELKDWLRTVHLDALDIVMGDAEERQELTPAMFNLLKGTTSDTKRAIAAYEEASHD